MKVRVGIVSYRTPEHLVRCLAALPAPLVVVDNSSRDSSPDIARAAGAVVIVIARNVGYARAMNQARK